jgi:anthranilate/para-aminobenzoate synthase component I
VGVLPYEAFRDLERRSGHDVRPATIWDRPLWHRYPAAAAICGDTARITGETREAVARLAAVFSSSNGLPREAPSLSWRTPPEPAELHRRRIGLALDYIAQGDLYQVNLARRFEMWAQGGPFALLAALERGGEAPFGAAFHFGDRALVSLSPELFLDASLDGEIYTRPIKGTRPRLADALLDAALILDLDHSEKERAELSMIIDIERNDLGRLAETGSVHLRRAPQVVTYPTVHHREAEIGARLPLGTTWEHVLSVMCPSGSVTGAPKVSAMDVIARLEAHRRGLYTGALGFIARSGRLSLSMAIRTLMLEGQRAEYFSGGGIVADSDPQQEVEETLWKAEQLSSLVELGRALR